MSDNLQSWMSLMFGAAGLLAIGGLDAFLFHRFGITFDGACIISFGVATGIHWAAAPVLPFGRPKENAGVG